MQGPKLGALQSHLRVSRADRDLTLLSDHLGVSEDELLERLLRDMHERGGGSRDALVRLQTEVEAERQRPRLKLVSN